MRRHPGAARKKCQLNNGWDRTTFKPEVFIMEARIIIPTADGERLSYDLRMHHGGSGEELKIVFNTSEEPFESWLYYLLRDIGAHVVTDDPARLGTILGLSPGDAGIMAQDAIGETDMFRTEAKT